MSTLLVVRRRFGRRGLLLAAFVTTLLVTVVVAALLTRSGGAGHRSFAASVPPNASQVAQIRTTALATARDAGEGQPYGGALVSTTLQAANSLFGVEGPDTDASTDVFIMELRGNFEAKYARAKTPPRGSSMILVFDAATLEPIAFELNNGSKSVASLGVPVRAVDLK